MHKLSICPPKKRDDDSRPDGGTGRRVRLRGVWATVWVQVPLRTLFLIVEIMVVIRPQWPHTVDDIVKSLDGVWGVVGAISSSGNLIRLERSFKEPTVYRFVEYKGTDENSALRELSFSAEERNLAINEFAGLLGFKRLG